MNPTDTLEHDPAPVSIPVQLDDVEVSGEHLNAAADRLQEWRDAMLSGHPDAGILGLCIGNDLALLAAIQEASHG